MSRTPESPPPDAAPEAPRGLRARLAGCLGRLLLVALALAVSGLVGELAVRWAMPQQLILLRPDVWEPHDGLGWVRKGGLDTRINTGEREVRLVTDPSGRRIGVDDQGRDRSPAIRVLALGDSFTAALQVEHEESFVGLLERRLSTELDTEVEVVNTGVAGYGPSHYRLVAADELAHREHDLVLVFLFLGNDVEDRRIEHFPPKQPTPVHELRLPEAWTLRELRDSFAYPLNDALERRSHLFVLARHRARFLLIRLGLSARRFPKAVLTSEAEAPRWELTADLAAETARLAAGHGAPTLFVLIPSTYQVNRELGLGSARVQGIDPATVDLAQPNRRLAEELLERDLAVLDTTPALEALAEHGERPHGTADTHLSPAGHETVAAVVEPRALELLGGRDRPGAAEDLP